MFDAGVQRGKKELILLKLRLQVRERAMGITDALGEDKGHGYRETSKGTRVWICGNKEE